MEMIVQFFLIISVASVYCQTLELSAYEYQRLTKSTLELGKCPHRVVQYPEQPDLTRCTFPKRSGKEQTLRKRVNSTKLLPIHNVSQLIQHIGMCDDKSADYFGLLAKGDDCVANEIAKKLSFTPKTSTWIFIEHFRPKVDILIPSATIEDVPSAFFNYLNNSYYTNYIGYGTTEILVLEMHFKSADDARRVDGIRRHVRHLSQVAESALSTRKVKVIRLSTAENIFHVKTFRGSRSAKDADTYIKHCEREILRIVKETEYGIRESPLKYGFKPYEIGPIALASSTISETEKRHLWETVAMLQVDAHRTYTTHKKYRKFCRRKKDKLCRDMRSAIKALKQTITKIHTQRRDWMNITYDQQLDFVKREKNTVKWLKTQIIIMAKDLRKMMKKKS